MIAPSKCALACLLLSVAQALAQSTTPVSYLQTVSTGMVGFTSSQTARLNVLNLAASSGAGPTCSVQLAFYDEKNDLLKQATVSALAPQAVTSLELTRPELTSILTATLRAQIRGVVRSSPAATALPTPMYSVPITSVIYVTGCSVVTTLEIFDTATGVTQLLTSDTHSPSYFLANSFVAPQY
jgi:hypothetical protein